MLSTGMLSDETTDYGTFLSKLSDDSGRERLYGVLKQNGNVDSDYNAFSNGFFAGYDDEMARVLSEKKKDVPDGSDSADGSLDTQNAAPDAEGGFDAFDPFSYGNLNRPELGGGYQGGGIEETANLNISNTELTDKIRARSDERRAYDRFRQQQTGVAPKEPEMVDGVPVISTGGIDQGALTPEAPKQTDLPTGRVKSGDDPLAAGDAMYKALDEGYETKERIANKSGYRKGQRDLLKIEHFANTAGEQSEFGEFRMAEAYGPDWKDQLVRAKSMSEAPPASANPDEVIQAQALYNRMKNDPAFTDWAAGQEGLLKSSGAYRKIVRSNPDFARAMADMERANSNADESALFKGLSLMGQVTGPVIAGIATLPRTLLQAGGATGYVPVVEEIADWGDRQNAFIETKTSTGSKSNRTLWEKQVNYNGMQVTVDDEGRPMSAYKDGRKVDMSEEQVTEFIRNGAGNKAREQFTGWENAGFSTAKTLANLYLMRNLGAGTKVGTGATSFIITYNDLYQEAMKNLGYGPEDAAQYAMANAGVQAAAEAYLGNIDVAPIKLQAARTFGLNEARALTGTMSAREVGKIAGKAVMKEVLGENAEEITQMASDHLATALFNAKTGGDIKRDISAQEIAETILLTTVTTIMAGGADAARGAIGGLQQKSLLAAVEQPEAAAKVFDEVVATGKMTPEAAQSANTHLVALQKVAQRPDVKEMDDDKKAHLLTLELAKMQLEGAVAKKDEGSATAAETKAAVEEEIKYVNNPAEFETPPPGLGIGRPQISAETTTLVAQEVSAPPVADLPQAEVGMEIPANESPISEPEAVVTPESPNASSLLSDRYKDVVDDADRANVQQWVNDNINDPEVVADYESRGFTPAQMAQDLVGEYESNILANKYAQPKSAKKDGAKPDGAKEKSSTKKAVRSASKKVANLTDAQVAEVETAMAEYTTPSGDVDLDKLEDDIAAGKPIPEPIKEIIDEQKIGNIDQQDQRNESADIPVQTPEPANVGQPVAAGPVSAVGTDATSRRQKGVAAQKKQIDAELAKAPLPDIDEDVLTEMVADELISSDTHDAAAAYLDGQITEDAAKAYQEAEAAKAGLRTPADRETILWSKDVEVERRTDTGNLEVSGAGAAGMNLADVGGVWNPIAMRWDVPKDREVDVLNRIVESREETVRRTDAGALGADLLNMLRAPGATINARRRRNRFKAASSFEERLRIAQVEHGMRKTATDPKAWQRVLEKMKKAFPGVNIITGAQEFEAKISDIAKEKGLRTEAREGVVGFLFDDGRWEAPMAFESGGDIYVNPRVAHPDTLIHEIGHIWNSWLRVNNPEQFQRGVDAVRDTAYHEAVMDHPLYQGLSEEQQVEEALAQAIGDAGKMIMDMGPFMRFRTWLKDMWRSVARMTGIRDAQEHTIEQWANAQAQTLLSGNVLTAQSGKDIITAETDMVAVQRAQAMERAGMMPEQIRAVTNWKRGDSGEWESDPVKGTAKYDEQSFFPAGKVVPFSEVITAPDLEAAYPDGLPMVRIERNIQNPRMENGVLVMTPVVAQHYVDSAVQAAQASLPTPRLDKGAVQVPVRFAALGNGMSRATRIQSARQIIEIEMQSEGMKDYEKKTRRIADALNLRYEDVLRIWQDEADRARYGRVTVALGDARATGGGMFAQFMEGARIKKNIVQERVSTFMQQYCTVRGLFPPEIKSLADQVGQRIAGRMIEARYILKDLEKAMKKEYGNPTEAHWRLVDNVLRGEGDWDVLPQSVAAPAQAMRNFTDSLSQELITSGATNGKMIITILNNSGVAATEEKLRDWNGVNLFEALNELPYARTAEQQAAIKSFLERNNRMLGSYFYRSYRKHKDKGWKHKVPPQVMADARAFLRNEMEGRIKVLEEARDVNVEKLEKQIIDLSVEISKMTDEVNMKLAEAKKAYDSTPLPNIGKTNSPAAQLFVRKKAVLENLKKWIDAQVDVFAVVDADLEILFDLTGTDLSDFAAPAKAIVDARKKLYDLQELQDAAVNFNQEELDNLMRMLDVPYGNMGRDGGIDGLIYNEILATEDTPGAVLTNERLGSKELSFLKKRKDIPPPIRELMGEYHDARINFAQSVVRMVSTIENQKFLTDLRGEFEGKFFWPPHKKDMGVEMASEGSASMDPLNGWRTTPEIKKALTDHYSPRVQTHIIISGLRYMSDAVKFGKTILSPITHFRNFWGNLFFVVQNGYNPLHIAKAYDAFKNAWDLKTSDDHRAYIEKLASLGIVGGGAFSGDIKAVVDRTNADIISKMFTDGGSVTKIIDYVQRTYTAEDDFFRIMGFETEKARYSKAIYGRPFEQLSPAQQSDMERKAADLVAANMPTYSKVPRAISYMREVPLFGTFVAFPAEMFRITANQAKQVLIDLRDPRTRSIGIIRMAGMTAAQSIPLIATNIFRNMFGVSADEEDAARYFVPEWLQDTQWLWDSFEPGKGYSFRNLGYSDPYAFYKKPIITMMTNNGRNMTAKLADGAYGLVEPFLDIELTTGTILALAFNTNPRNGEPIYNPGAGMLGDWRNTKDFALRQLQPGIVKLAYDVESSISGEGQFGKRPKSAEDIALSFFGMQTEKTDLQKAVRSKIKDAKTKLDYARDMFTDEQYKYKTSKVELDALYERTTEQYQAALRKLGVAIKNAEILGLPPEIVNDMASSGRQGFSENELWAARSGGTLLPMFKGYNK